MQHNLKDRLARIPFLELPRTFQDAVTVVRNLKLGIRLLWIDSLCIIQGDKEDFERECAKMHDTFTNAVVTICGPSAVDTDAGFLFEREDCSVYLGSEQRLEVQIGNEPVEVTITSQRSNQVGTRKQLNSVLSSRAWIFQERLLSTRVLYFGKNQMYMECSSADFYEYLRTPLKALTNNFPRSKEALKVANQDDALRQWNAIIQEYSTCDIGKGDDWLPALSGTASRLSKSLNAPYYAGLWRYKFVRQLAWHKGHRLRGEPRPSTERRSATQATVRPPSWSWASCEYGVWFFWSLGSTERWTDYAQIMEICAPPVGLDPFGQVDRRSAYTTLQAPCRAAIVRRDRLIKSRRGWDRGEFDEWVYSTDDRLVIGRMIRDDPSYVEHDERVVVLLLAAQPQLYDNRVNMWAALVLRRIERIDGESIPPSWETYCRIGLVGIYFRDLSHDIVARDNPAGPGEVEAHDHIWSWMKTGDLRTITLL